MSIDIDGRTFSLRNIHSHLECLDRPCVIHNRTDHHMRSWPIHWRSDRSIFERICPHGIGHPDPDQFDYWRNRDAMFKATHGCDGCCIYADDQPDGAA